LEDLVSKDYIDIVYKKAKHTLNVSFSFATSPRLAYGSQSHDDENAQLAVENHHLNPYRTYMLELIDYLVFNIPLKSISLIGRLDHY
jgi:hypothetical protein